MITEPIAADAPPAPAGSFSKRQHSHQQALGHSNHHPPAAPMAHLLAVPSAVAAATEDDKAAAAVHVTFPLQASSRAAVAAVAAASARTQIGADRYRHDPYRASVLPPLASNVTAGPFAPNAAVLAAPPPPPPQPGMRVGFAARVKADVACADVFGMPGSPHTHHHHHQHFQGHPFGDNFAPAALLRAPPPLAAAAAAARPSFGTVRFKHESVVYRVPPELAAGALRVGDHCVVEGDRGVHVGMLERIAADAPPFRVASSVLRAAAPEEALRLAALRLHERQAAEQAQGAADALGLPMTVDDVEFQFDMQKLTVFYTPARGVSGASVDFRALQRILFRIHGCRIWIVPLRDVQRLPLAAAAAAALPAAAANTNGNALPRSGRR